MADQNNGQTVDASTNDPFPTGYLLLLTTIFKLCRTLPSEEEVLNHIQRFQEVPTLEAKIQLHDQSISDLQVRLTKEEKANKAAINRVVSAHAAECRELQVQLQEKGKKIEELREHLRDKDAELKKSMTRSDKVSSTARNSEALLKKTQQQLEQTKLDIKDRDSQIAKLETEVEKQQRKAEENKKTATAALADYNNLSKERESVSNKLLALDRCRARLVDWSRAAELFDAWNEAWTKTMRLVHSTPFRDADETDDHCLEHLRAFTGWNNISLLSHGTVHFSKATLEAMVVAAISRIMDQHILQPNYLLPSENGVRSLFFRQAQSDSKKEMLLRSCLLSLLPEEQHRRVDSRILSATWLVMNAVSGVISSKYAEDFRTTLELLLREFYSTWTSISHLETAIEPYFTWTAEEVHNGSWKRAQVTMEMMEVVKMHADDCERGSNEFAVMIPSLCAWKNGQRQIVSKGAIFIRADIAKPGKRQQSAISTLISTGLGLKSEWKTVDSSIKNASTDTENTQALNPRLASEDSVKGNPPRKSTSETSKNGKTSRARKDSKVDEL